MFNTKNLCPCGFSIQELDVDTCINCSLYPCSYYLDDDKYDDLDEIALENEQRELHYGGQSEFRDHWTLDE